MMTRPIILLSLLACLWQTAEAQEVQLLCDGALRFIELTGTPYERGLTHGRALRDDIHALVDLWKADMARTARMEAEEFITLFLAGTDYESAIRAHTPELLDELRGIADGSGVAYTDLFMFQLVDEYWFNAGDILGRRNSGSVDLDRYSSDSIGLQPPGCTSIGLDRSADRPALTAQNMDIPPFYHGYQMVMEITEPDSGLRTLILTFPGHLGTTAMNDRGVSINVNTLIQLDYGTTGLPVTYVVRGAAACATQPEAVDLVRSVTHASGQNYIVGGPEHVVCLECSAGRKEEFRPFPGAPYTYHTNHPRANTDYSRGYRQWLRERGRTAEQEAGTCRRFIALDERFTAAGDDFSIDLVKTVLSSRDHERDPISNSNTFACVIYELGEQPCLHIAPGRPHETPFVIIEF